jgi:hypothetical protein
MIETVEELDGYSDRELQQKQVYLLDMMQDTLERIATAIEAKQENFQWLVHLTGVKSPGPHAGFALYQDARRFAAYFPAGGTVNGQQIEHDPRLR